MVSADAIKIRFTFWTAVALMAVTGAQPSTDSTYAMTSKTRHPHRNARLRPLWSPHRLSSVKRGPPVWKHTRNSHERGDDVRAGYSEGSWPDTTREQSGIKLSGGLRGYQRRGKVGRRPDNASSCWGRMTADLRLSKFRINVRYNSSQIARLFRHSQTGLYQKPAIPPGREPDLEPSRQLDRHRVSDTAVAARRPPVQASRIPE